MHPLNVKSPKTVTDLGIVILVSDVHPENAPLTVATHGLRPTSPPPISVTESGMVMLISPVHPWNAPLPILVTELGFSICLSSVQLRNALSAIAFVLFEITQTPSFISYFAISQ